MRYRVASSATDWTVARIDTACRSVRKDDSALPCAMWTDVVAVAWTFCRTLASARCSLPTTSCSERPLVLAAGNAPPRRSIAPASRVSKLQRHAQLIQKQTEMTAHSDDKRDGGHGRRRSAERTTRGTERGTARRSKEASLICGTCGERPWLLRSRPDQVSHATMRRGPPARIITDAGGLWG
jgi:hypothetical protein